MSFINSIGEFVRCFFARFNKTTCTICAEKLSDGQLDHHLETVHKECWDWKRKITTSVRYVAGIQHQKIVSLFAKSVQKKPLINAWRI